MAKGAALHATLEYFDQRDPDLRTRVLARLTPAERAAVERLGPTSELPYALMVAVWEAADAELGGAEPTWMEEAGGYSIRARGAQMYGGILRKKSPLEFLTQSISLFRLFYHPGDMQVVDEQVGRAVLRLDGFDATTPLFCQRQTGGLAAALELAGGDEPVVRHVRCALEGDAFCEWELKWRVPRASRTSGETAKV
ncbi:MAG: hypothetical protein FJ363_11310 [Gemmatimonadetes bacterium]|nr:hypothetical protein [Gemmatimonadota bacterium]